MLKYTVKRLLMMIPALLGITVVSFAVMHLAPGRPTDLATDLNPQATLEARLVPEGQNVSRETI